jgi:hypothetical protein
VSALKDLKNSLAKAAFGMTPDEAQAQGICIKCKEPALPKCYSAAGRREYQISRMCEECFDALFNGSDEPEDPSETEAPY